MYISLFTPLTLFIFISWVYTQAISSNICAQAFHSFLIYLVQHPHIYPSKYRTIKKKAPKRIPGTFDFGPTFFTLAYFDVSKIYKQIAIKLHIVCRSCILSVELDTVCRNLDDPFTFLRSDHLI